MPTGKQRMNRPHCVELSGRMPCTTLRLVAVASVVLILASCSHRDSVFSGSPLYSGFSGERLRPVVECIAQRWTHSARQVHRSSVGTTLRLQGETYFRGVPIGIKAWRIAGRTTVQFFAGRVADRIYVLSVKSCLR